MTSSAPFATPPPNVPFWRRHLSRRAWTVLLLTGAAVYLVVPPGEGCACGTPAGYRAQLKGELRLVVIAQESFFADSQRYGRNLTELNYGTPERIRVAVDSVTGAGYRARAGYVATTNVVYGRAGTCVVWVGDSALAVPTVPEGEPRCWVPRRPLWRYGTYRPPGAVLQ